MSAFRKDYPWRDRAREMRARGLSWEQIARIVGVKRDCVRYNIDENFRSKNIKSASENYHGRKQMTAAE